MEFASPVQAPLFKHYYKFQDGENRTLNQAGHPSTYRALRSCMGCNPTRLVLLLSVPSKLPPASRPPRFWVQTQLSPLPPPQVLNTHRLHVLTCSFGCGPQTSCLPFSSQESVIMPILLSNPDHLSLTPRWLPHPPQLQHPAISKSNEYCLFLAHMYMH